MKNLKIIAGVLGLFFVVILFRGCRHSPPPAALPSMRSVSTQTIKASPYTVYLKLYGTTKPCREVELRAETSGTIIEEPAEEGRFLKKGSVLAVLSLDGKDKELKAAQSLLHQRKKQYDSAQALSQKSYQSPIQLAGAETNLKEAESRFSTARKQFRNAKILMPFDGLFVERLAEVGDFVQPGQALAKIANLNSIKITAYISETDIDKVFLGMKGTVIFNDQLRLEGTVNYKSHVGDPATHMFRIELIIPLPEKLKTASLAERTIMLHLNLKTVKAHKISPTYLTILDEGLGVKVVDAQQRVQIKKVTLLNQERNGIWVQGLPDTVDLITAGQGFVEAGDPVKAVKK